MKAEEEREQRREGRKEGTLLLEGPTNLCPEGKGPLKALSTSSFMWKDHSCSKTQEGGKGSFHHACLVHLPCCGVCLPSFQEPQGEKKGHDAEFNCVNLPNPHLWHFCFGSQTLLVFLGVSVPLKDIIKSFFSPLKNVGPLGHFTFMSRLCFVNCSRCARSPNTETSIASWGRWSQFWAPAAIPKLLPLHWDRN